MKITINYLNQKGGSLNHQESEEKSIKEWSEFYPRQMSKKKDNIKFIANEESVANKAANELLQAIKKIKELQILGSTDYFKKLKSLRKKAYNAVFEAYISKNKKAADKAIEAADELVKFAKEEKKKEEDKDKKAKKEKWDNKNIIYIHCFSGSNYCNIDNNIILPLKENQSLTKINFKKTNKGWEVSDKNIDFEENKENLIQPIKYLISDLNEVINNSNVNDVELNNKLEKLRAFFNLLVSDEIKKLKK